MSFYTEVIQKAPAFHSLSCVRETDLLEPVTRRAVAAIIAAAKAQRLSLMVFETYRSCERQSALYAQGATTLRDVSVHHYGLACDIVRDINGEPSWRGSFALLGQLAREHRLIWGGDWKQYDACHVQRCALADQPKLFGGSWYPEASYDPYSS